MWKIDPARIERLPDRVLVRYMNGDIVPEAATRFCGCSNRHASLKSAASRPFSRSLSHSDTWRQYKPGWAMRLAYGDGWYSYTYADWNKIREGETNELGEVAL